MSRCLQELCTNWSGEGDVCACALFDLTPTRDTWMDDDEEANDA